MKITKSELKSLIKEEAEKYKKTLVLESKKKDIESKMKALYESEEEYSEIMEMFKPKEEVEEAFLGIMGADEKLRKSTLEKRFEQMIAQGAIGDKAQFLEKAKSDNNSGSLSIQLGKSGKFAGKKIIIYTPKPTTMQKMAAGTGAVTGGGGTGAKTSAF